MGNGIEEEKPIGSDLCGEGEILNLRTNSNWWDSEKHRGSLLVSSGC